MDLVLLHNVVQDAADLILIGAQEGMGLEVGASELVGEGEVLVARFEASDRGD